MTDLRFIEVSVLLITVGFLLSSCGTVRTSKSVDTSSEEIVETGARIGAGIASWYGPNFHGRQTANGERYNMDGLTAAHKTLPFNTFVRVVNQDNGRAVDVRINDRGPYVGDRIIDLSRKAAYEIDMIQTGTANVHIYLLDEGDRPISASNISSRETFTIQLASFLDRGQARHESQKIDGARVVESVVSGKTVYRIYYGSYQRVADAEDELNILSRNGHHGFIKQIED